MVLKTTLVILLGICVLHSCSLAAPCWEEVVPQNVVGFDFEVTSVVEGPNEAGIYTYNYTLYRIDNGLTCYRDVSHIAFWFPCKLGAQKSVLNGQFGISMTCTGGGCPVLEMGGTNGMTEPVLDPACRFFWGFKFDECSETGGGFLRPKVDEISYPDDPLDPYCTIVLRSSAGPEWGKWLIKGGDGKSGLYDAGDIKVPTCMPAVSTDDLSWGSIKVLYR
ncbi:MAG: hypothetical protein JSW03_10675 [Candidatus Eiseniibacteriota bacterium]|nr:MAG: hypothetical protein JSW03_10675 [Candidatus Eisenbacteria bacterium]